MIDAVSRAAGRRTGLFTSPHLVSFRERIRIDGEPVAHGEVAAGLTRLRELTDGWSPPPTFFELTTALAALCFAEAGTEVVGLGNGPRREARRDQRDYARRVRADVHRPGPQGVSG